YRRAVADRPLEVVSWRIRARGPLPAIALAPAPAGRAPGHARRGRRPVYFDGAGGFVEAPVYARDLLGAGGALRGPVILEERESTLVVPPGARVTIDRLGNAVVTLQPGGTSRRAR